MAKIKHYYMYHISTWQSYVINNENASGNYSGSINNFNQDKMVIDTLNRYILKLEKENEVISAKNNQLEQENERLRGK